MSQVSLPVHSWYWCHPEMNFLSNRMICKFQLPGPNLQFQIYDPPLQLQASKSLSGQLHQIECEKKLHVAQKLCNFFVVDHRNLNHEHITYSPKKTEVFFPFYKGLPND
jgi:hypothetical protein